MHATMQASAITELQATVDEVWKEYQDLFRKAVGQHVTLEDIRYAYTLVRARCA